MDAKTQQMFVTVGAGLAKKVLMLQAAGLVSHGVMSSNYTEVFVSLGMAAVGAAWSLWQDFGKAIFYSQMEVLKAKSLAQAEKMRLAGVSPVTMTQIANQSSKMNAAEVTKVAATLPADVQANIAPVVVKGLVLLVALVLTAFLSTDPASAQIKRPQFTGDVAADTRANLGLNGTAGQAATSPLANILGALDDKVLPDLQYALKLAIAGDSKVTAPCYQAWIDIINKRKVAVTNTDGTPLDLPQPRIITDFEKAIELRNALQPDSDFSIKCAPVVAMVKLDLISFMGKIIAGGAGLATLVPGL